MTITAAVTANPLFLSAAAPSNSLQELAICFLQNHSKVMSIFLEMML